MAKHDIVIVGAGISGATLAERYANEGKKVWILEKRDHIGGNCYDYVDPAGILVSKYGAHIFHTNFEDVWQYINRFAPWRPYYHKVLASVDGQLVPVPVNIVTVNKLLGLHIKNSAQMEAWLKGAQIQFTSPKNSEQVALSRVGKVLYEKLFRNYTKKQWNKEPAELDALVLARIPVRNDFNDGYFSDKYQALPAGGYTRLFEKMLGHPNIHISLNADFFQKRQEAQNCEKLFYTGPIDGYFNYSLSGGKKLQYRSLRFEFETHNKEFYQSNSVINYPNTEAFTRIVEYKHFTGQKNPRTTISKEYPSDVGEPYYPLPSPENLDLYEQYAKAAAKLKGIHFVGRLANYKYFNMDQAFKNALDLFTGLT
ncbi:MAG: UDP-galactopyranose mutase [Candidatus Doudnabacteria bacterium]|nr:UDP-galactopyranose mutase [Candidatus Doudnabacteria bacterium]